MLSDILFLDAVQYIATVALGAGGAWVIAQLSPGIVARLKDTWRIIRDYEPELVAAVDQPSDPIIQLLGQIGVPEDRAAELAPRVVRFIFDVAQGKSPEDAESSAR